jgi:hypothetical protein
VQIFLVIRKRREKNRLLEDLEKLELFEENNELSGEQMLEKTNILSQLLEMYAIEELY